MTHTRVHTYVSFANPHLVCGLCRRSVPRWHNNDTCGCDAGWWNNPCGHRAEAVSACPSWDPANGCYCAEALGHIPHPPAASKEH